MEKKKAIDQKANNILFAVAAIVFAVCARGAHCAAARERQANNGKEAQASERAERLFIYFVCEPFHLFAQMAEWQNIWTIWQNT